MESIGHTFKTTRERKRISLAYAASKTRIKLQNLEMMERDDFSRIPAPAYAKGFIRMYAEFLGIDPAPLVQFYVAHHQDRKPAAAAARPPAPARPTAPARTEPSQRDMVEEETAPPEPVEPAVPVGQRLKTWSAAARTPENLRRAGMVALVVVLAWALVAGISHCARRVAKEEAAPAAVTFKKGVPSVIQDPPEPYLDIPATKEPVP